MVTSILTAAVTLTATVSVNKSKMMCLDYLGLGPGRRQVGPGEVGLPLQRQDVGVTGPLFTEGVVVDVAELWLRVLFVHPAEIVVELIYSHHGRTLFPLV